MKKNLTELVFVLDMSGSMHHLSKDTIGGFNSMLEKHKALDGDAYVSTFVFNDRWQLLHDRVDIRNVKPISEKEYCPSGCTALLDTVGHAIKHIAGIHRYSRPQDVPEKTLFMITTDGMENASRHYSLEKVRAMIEKERGKYGWEFVFVGANIDAIATAGAMGIPSDRSANYVPDAQGSEKLYEVFGGISCCYRMSKDIDSGWKAELDEDCRNRKV